MGGAQCTGRGGRLKVESKLPAFNDVKGRSVPPGSIGFIGSHVVKALLAAGYIVRACVRDAESKEKTAHLTAMKIGSGAKLELFSADLFKSGSYDSAFDGADAVIHCAAVVANKNSVKGDPYEAIVSPSVKGTQNVTTSIHKANSVKRVIHTSSLAAIQTYDKAPNYFFSEKDWNTWSNEVNQDYYGLGKTLAEQEAIKMSSGKSYDLVVINPCVVLGECLTKKHTKASPVFVRELLYGNKLPDTPVNFVDVIDVATAHVEALKRPEAGSNRFLISGDHTSHFWRFAKLAQKLGKLYPQYTFKANVYSGLLYNIAWYTTMTEFERAVIQTDIKLDNTKSKEVLGIKYADFDDTLRATIDSMVTTNFVKVKRKE
eukprot:jgi/Bigna1/131025/aug1.13_g5733